MNDYKSLFLEVSNYLRLLAKPACEPFQLHRMQPRGLAILINDMTKRCPSLEGCLQKKPKQPGSARQRRSMRTKVTPEIISDLYAAAVEQNHWPQFSAVIAL